MSSSKPQSVVATSAASAAKEIENRAADILSPNAVDDAVANACKTTKHAFDEALAYTKGHPDKALLYAATAGYALRVLPVARILGGVVRLAVPLVKPAILYYGITKILAARRS